MLEPGRLHRCRAPFTGDTHWRYSIRPNGEAPMPQGAAASRDPFPQRSARPPAGGGPPIRRCRGWPIPLVFRSCASSPNGLWRALCHAAQLGDRPAHAIRCVSLVPSGLRRRPRPVQPSLRGPVADRLVARSAKALSMPWPWVSWITLRKEIAVHSSSCSGCVTVGLSPYSQKTSLTIVLVCPARATQS